MRPAKTQSGLAFYQVLSESSKPCLLIYILKATWILWSDWDDFRLILVFAGCTIYSVDIATNWLYSYVFMCKLLYGLCVCTGDNPRALESSWIIPRTDAQSWIISRNFSSWSISRTDAQLWIISRTDAQTIQYPNNFLNAQVCSCTLCFVRYLM